VKNTCLRFGDPIEKDEFGYYLRLPACHHAEEVDDLAAGGDMFAILEEKKS